jgi:hypothetical protein
LRRGTRVVDRTVELLDERASDAAPSEFDRNR